MTDKEALKLALEALELHGKQYPHMVKGYCLDAITAIKQALADSALDRMAENARELGLDYGPAQEQVAGFNVVLDKGMPPNTMKFVQPAPVQQSRSDVEPVAWVVEDEHGERLEWAGDAHSCHGLPTLPLYTTPPVAQPAPVQEPDFYRHEDGHLMTPDRVKFLGFDLDDLQPLYTTPPAQPASEEDMKVYRAIADNYRKDLAAAQRQWVEVEQIKWDGDKLIAKLKENT